MKPHTKCIKCNKVIEFIGGQRLVNYWNMPESIKKRIENYSDKESKAWICQICANKAICKICGSPLQYAPGSEIILETGEIKHVSLLGTTPSCSNPDCSKYQETKYITQ